MIAARRSPTCSSLAPRSSTSTLPLASVATTTTCRPAITALAAFVPWALDGMRQTRALVVAVGAVVGADGEQAGELALAAGVGLHADGVVAGDLGQPRLQLGDQRAQARPSSSSGANGCRLGELRPRDRHHLGRRVELHRARPERDHRAVERQVVVGEPAQVAQHLVLGVVAVEHRLREELAARATRRRGARRRTCRRVVVVECGTERRQQPVERGRASRSRRTSGRRRRASTRRRSTSAARGGGEQRHRRRRRRP